MISALSVLFSGILAITYFLLVRIGTIAHNHTWIRPLWVLLVGIILFVLGVLSLAGVIEME